MMRLKKFAKMTNAYGADWRRWPVRLRSQAQTVLARSSAAREILRRATALDDALMEVSEAKDSQFATREEWQAALVRLRAGVMHRIGPHSDLEKPIERASPLSALLELTLWRHRWIGFAAVASFIVLGGLALGFVYSPVPSRQDFVTLLQPAPVQFLVN